MAITAAATRYNMTLKADFNADTIIEVQSALSTNPTLYEGKYFRIADQGNDIFQAVYEKPNSPLILLPAYEDPNWTPVLPDEQDASLELPINSDTTLTDDTYLYISVDTTSGPVTLTLPPADTVNGDFLYVKKVSNDVNDVIIQGNSGEQIEFMSELRIKFFRSSVGLYSNGINWKA